MVPTVRHNGANIILWGCFAAGGAGALCKIDGSMKKKDYLDTPTNLNKLYHFRQEEWVKIPSK